MGLMNHGGFACMCGRVNCSYPKTGCHFDPVIEKRLNTEGSALSSQIGGNHYKKMAIQPAEYLHKNGIGFMEGSAIKYLSRWRDKGGVEDLKKARHFIDLLIEMESRLSVEDLPPRKF